MKIHQLRYLVAIADSDLNITAASNNLHTSQPGISKQIRLLETELGFMIFNRRGRSLTRMTPAGDQVVKRAQRVLHEIESIRRLSDDLSNPTAGTLAIGATHMQARYVLPQVISGFLQRYPEVKLKLHQGTSAQLAEMIQADQVDFAVSSGPAALFPEMTMLPGYQWRRAVAVPAGHPLARAQRIDLKTLAEFPLIGDTFTLAASSFFMRAFAEAGLQPIVALMARDSDVIKTYVRAGLGVGILPRMAVSATEEPDLVAIEAPDLFPAHTAWIGFRADLLMRRYMFDFLQSFAPHLGRQRVEDAAEARDQKELDALFSDVELPVR
jgi:LysR family cys regulon transcriptional activator